MCWIDSGFVSLQLYAFLQGVLEYFDIWLQGHIYSISVSPISFLFTGIVDVITIGNISNMQHDYFKIAFLRGLTKET